MKILFLTRLYYPHIGGVEGHVEEVSRRLMKRGHEVRVVCESPSRFTGSSTSGEPFGYPRGVFAAYRISVGKIEKLKKFQIWWWLWKNRSLINRSDIVHVHDVAFWYFPFRFLYAKKPFFITFHGWEGKYPIPLRNKIIRKINEKLARGNICVGDYIAKWYGTKPDYVTYGGVKLKNSKTQKLKTNQKLKDKNIIFIGRLEKDTGLSIYIEAFEKFIIHNSKFKIQFLGERRVGEQAGKLGKVLGFIRNIRPYILNSRFVFTSGYLSILEAIIAKKLVFAVYDNPLKEDYLKMAPFAEWIVIEKNPERLAEKIKYYLHHPEEEKKLTERAYNWAKEQTWEKVAEIYLKLWRIP